MQGQSTNNTWNHSEYSLMEENTQLGDEECNRSKSVEKDVADLTKSMKDELASKCYEPDYSATILRVPEEMRNDDPGAYSPKVVSIGPFHRSSQNVQHMEQLKWHCLEKFLSCKPEKDLQMYVMEMKKLEREARSCYKGNDEMESEEFVRMMVLDGCFIIQLLFQLEDDFLFVREDGFAPEDPIYGDRWMLPRVAHDMLLLENQLPFFILEQLWGLTRDGPWDALSIRRFLRGGSFPDKVIQIQELEPLSEYDTSICSLGVARCHSYNDLGLSEPIHSSFERERASTSNTISDSNCHNLKLPVPKNGSTSRTLQRFISGARATDSARVARFRRELSVRTVILETLRELSWSGIPPYMRPDVWRLLLGYTTPNSDRRERVLKRKQLQYVDCVSQYYDIPDSERSEDEINMLRQIAVDCPRTVPDITFFQQVEVQKSLERILYIWAIRHPASGYVQGVNDLVTPFLIVFLSEHLQENMDKWSISDLSPSKFSNIEADCYWCLTKFLDGMQDHYTFSQPGIQRLVFKLKELVRRINEPISRHMEEEGLDFLQFSFRWFNCLLIREIPFHLVTRLWDTYLAEGDALPGFLVYICASFLLTWSDMLGKLDFQEMVMFLQHLPTQNWTHQDLEMVLSRAYMWHTMFESSPNHLA